MDKTLLFYYCITDGALDELPEEQRTAIIHIIKGMLQERDHTQNETK